MWYKDLVVSSQSQKKGDKSLIERRIPIRRHDCNNGYFSLRDLHRASISQDCPLKWLKSPQISEVIADIEYAGKPATLKKGSSTYICHELMYMYASSVSPAFALQVIRAYDALSRAPSFPIDMPDGYRYYIKIALFDIRFNEIEKFAGFTKTPDEIIHGTAKHFGMLINELITSPAFANLSAAFESVNKELEYSKDFYEQLAEELDCIEKEKAS